LNQSQGLIKAYKIDDAAGVGQYLAVVCGANDGCVKKPTGANVAGFVGITVEAQANQNKGVAVQKAGIARVKGAGAITRGDRLVINGNTGAVKSAEAVVVAAPGTASVQNVIGIAETSAADGDIFPMWIAPCVVNIAVS
jgi:uncharacterized protein with beta-barrel porin domain